MKRCLSSCAVSSTMLSHGKWVEDDNEEEMVYVESLEVLEFQNKQSF